MKRWKQYFSDLLGRAELERETRNRQVNNSNLSQHPEKITEKDVKGAIRHIQKRKAIDSCLRPEMFKSLGEKGIKMLTTNYKRTRQQEIVSADWEVGVVLILKKRVLY